MTRSNLMGYLMCLIASTVGLAIVVPELMYYVPLETGLFTMFIVGFLYALTKLLKCVR